MHAGHALLQSLLARTTNFTSGKEIRWRLKWSSIERWSRRHGFKSAIGPSIIKDQKRVNLIRAKIILASGHLLGSSDSWCTSTTKMPRSTSLRCSSAWTPPVASSSSSTRSSSAGRSRMPPRDSYREQPPLPPSPPRPPTPGGNCDHIKVIEWCRALRKGNKGRLHQRCLDDITTPPLFSG